MTTDIMATPVKHHDGIVWDEAGLTSLGVKVYTEGDCWALAWEVFQLTKGKLHLITDKSDDGYWAHVAVEVAPDLFLDAHGLQTKSEVESRWRMFAVPYEWSVDDFYSFRDDLAAEWVFGNARRTTRTVAKRLVATYC